MFYNTDFREPLPSEFCVSASMAKELANQDVWETDVARFGFGVWLAMHCLAESKQIVQVDLGPHGDPSGDPGMPMDARFLQSVGTMFWLSGIYRKLWQANADVRQVPFFGNRQPDRVLHSRDCIGPLREAFLAGMRQYADEWATGLSDHTCTGHSCPWRKHLRPQSGQSPGRCSRLTSGRASSSSLLCCTIMVKAIPTKSWKPFCPIFYGRAAGYVAQTRGLSYVQREGVVQRVLQAFAASRQFFFDLWNNYRSPDRSEKGRWCLYITLK